MNNWKKIVAKNSAEKYKLPEGWDTREKIAKELECAPERVRLILAPGIASGEVQTKSIHIFDKVRRIAVRTQIFRKTPQEVASRKRPIAKKRR